MSEEIRALNNVHGHRGCGPPAFIGVNEWGPNINLIRDQVSLPAGPNAVLLCGVPCTVCGVLCFCAECCLCATLCDMCGVLCSCGQGILVLCASCHGLRTGLQAVMSFYRVVADGIWIDLQWVQRFGRNSELPSSDPFLTGGS